ncbi:MAG: hypothetical protein AMXMBFR20_23290 [Planctomycetia bacterium]
MDAESPNVLRDGQLGPLVVGKVGVGERLIDRHDADENAELPKGDVGEIFDIAACSGQKKSGQADRGEQES